MVVFNQVRVYEIHTQYSFTIIQCLQKLYAILPRKSLRIMKTKAGNFSSLTNPLLCVSVIRSSTTLKKKKKKSAYEISCAWYWGNNVFFFFYFTESVNFSRRNELRAVEVMFSWSTLAIGITFKRGRKHKKTWWNNVCVFLLSSQKQPRGDKICGLMLLQIPYKCEKSCSSVIHELRVDRLLS